MDPRKALIHWIMLSYCSALDVWVGHGIELKWFSGYLSGHTPNIMW